LMCIISAIVSSSLCMTCYRLRRIVNDSWIITWHSYHCNYLTPSHNTLSPGPPPKIHHAVPVRGVNAAKVNAQKHAKVNNQRKNCPGECSKTC
jgi:hypothetical protein